MRSSGLLLDEHPQVLGGVTITEEAGVVDTVVVVAMIEVAAAMIGMVGAGEAMTGVAGGATVAGGGMTGVAGGAMAVATAVEIAEVTPRVAVVMVVVAVAMSAVGAEGGTEADMAVAAATVVGMTAGIDCDRLQQKCTQHSNLIPTKEPWLGLQCFCMYHKFANACCLEHCVKLDLRGPFVRHSPKPESAGMQTH